MEKIAFDERGNQKFRKFLTGGLAGGTSVGLGLALMNYLKELRDETKEDTSADDNTLYLDIPETPQVPGAPVKRATISGGVGATVAVLAGLGSAAAVRKAFQELKKKELQKQLDKAQVAYTGNVVEESKESKKKASSGVPMQPGDIATSAPLAAILLTTLASGALTYKGLGKYFPAAKKPTSLAPKRVVIRRKKSQPSVYEEPNDEETEKTASYEEFPSCDMDDDALEFVVKIAMNNPARHSDLRNLVHAVAAGRHGELCKHGYEYGMESTLDLVKNASESNMHEERLALAVSHCVKSAFLRPIIEVLAFSEFNDMAPVSVKAASEMSEEAQETLCKIAAVLGAGFRFEFWGDKFDNRFTVKEAAAIAPAVLEQLLGDSLVHNPETAESAGQIPLSTETESEVSESQRPEDAVREDVKERIRVHEQQVEDEDEIDMLMSGMSGGEDQWAENHSAVPA